MIEDKEWSLRRGQYLGEISALCFVHLPPHLSSLPYLLAGTGSQLMVYDLASGVMLRSFQVFDGIRVHGISLASSTDHSSDSTAAFSIAVFGERRVKLFSLMLTSSINSGEYLHLSLTLVQSVPRLSHWVLDVVFFHEQGKPGLAIGCSDNSIYLWDILSCKVLSQVSCSERCLLYSMCIWGKEIGALLVASGTIFNEVIVWKLDCKSDVPAVHHGNLADEKGSMSPFQPYRAINLYRLTGHEGSIFRLAWSPDGSKVVSVSDDRSARVWALGECKCLHDLAEGSIQCVSSILFGHTARVWDCCIFDLLIVTAGEDCTCRVWGLDGTQLNLIKEHIGRGVWRCAYDPSFSLLVTAGFDSSIKVHQLHASPECLGKTVGASESSFNQKEAFKIYIPNSTELASHMDSKSEYVRCLHFSREDSLYVATNNGYVYHAKLHHTGHVRWTKLLHSGGDAPVICMDALSNESDPCETDDWVAIGDGKGRMMIAHIAGDVYNLKVNHSLIWPAEIERQLLGINWCQSLGCRFIFTADPRGRLKLWRLWNPLFSASHVEGVLTAELVYGFVSCFGMRIICLDASLEEEVLVCGDIRGNVLLFPLKKDLVNAKPLPLEENVSPLTYFKGAHGISTVCSVSIAGSIPSQLDIHSSGGDGCICYFEYDRNRKKLEFTGIQQVKELSTVHSVYSTANYNIPSGSYAIGFTSSEFIIWNLSSDRKVVQVSCGGWRRPHSYYLGHSPEMRNCFAFVKDGIINIERYWVTGNERKVYPKNLHLQFHGREIHSLCFIRPDPSLCNPSGKGCQFFEPRWIATGCEDGTVRLTRYEPETESWSVSMLLGEHVGGSAVRSICTLSKIHRVTVKATDVSESIHTQIGELENQGNVVLLVSVGAKRVITAWKQKVRSIEETMQSQYCEHENRDGITSHGPSPSNKLSHLSFQWLSSDMPTRNNNCLHENTDKIIEAVENVQPLSSKDRKVESELHLVDRCENDWRYLAVTAFLAKGSGSRATVCFVVVACSDATLSFRALVLPHRLWFDVAMLTPISHPVLSLQHVIVPMHSLCEDNIQSGDLYIVISGSTDGSISLWDLTEHVENFMRLLPGLEILEGIDDQKRPRTGRGSQGGRRWRSLGSHVSKKKSTVGELLLRDLSFREEKQENVSVVKRDMSLQNYCDDVDTVVGWFHTKQNTRVCSRGNNDASSSVHMKERRNIPSLSICEIGPLHVYNNIHQSGVNCLHVSNAEAPIASDSIFRFCVISGGDDQSINCLTFAFTSTQNLELSNLEADVSPSASQDLENVIYYFRIRNHQMRLLSVDKIISAHSSAVKGVWTDGRWVFSTGLDQRVRCWNIKQGKLLERAHLVISVPEPEALDAMPCENRDHYQIAVAGRGMQMIEFFGSGKMNHSQ
ncbi:unnamed protein product [Cuscuta epithymum]|uniref:WD repeat-containing protein 6 n=2 Tax=Cuscuta epithymum TaxID=186058 RepID=A0AAV0CPG9_9ASTE|nr:unnamed protein product [Cuscuta epithymum]